MGYQFYYTDNLNIRFFLISFLVISVVYVAKIGLQFYFIEESPSIIDKYIVAKDDDIVDLETVLINAV
jgi:hypothetical protein